ncbi:protein S100-A9-like [Hyperolius riggenbachi]|uniref:protein S100-A9-like n=1 Tax=Hyperolius riggenbachi TaxID=752182 RepID=UPI0035A307A0
MIFCFTICFISLFATCSSKKIQTPWLERTILTMVEAYNKCAKKEGDPTTLNVKELEEYVRMNMADIVQDQDPNFFKKTLQSYDTDRDGELTHKEFGEFQRQYMLAKYNQRYKTPV